MGYTNAKCSPETSLSFVFSGLSIANVSTEQPELVSEHKRAKAKMGRR
jgi:hypothetical protein